LKELYDRTKNENQFLAIKIGFELYDIFLKDNKYNDCIDILINMRNILKKRLLTGIKMDNAIDFYLSIISRLGYIGILTNNKGSIDNSIKKLKKSVDMFNKFTEENKDKSITLKKAYSFLLTILKINNNEKVEKQKEIAANFKSAFLPDLKKVQQNKFIGQFIINESNFYECVVNLNIINNMEYDTETFLKKEIYLPMLTTVTQNNPLQHKYVMTFILNVHNQINHYTESYCTDFNKDIYKDKIKDLTEKTLSYVRNYGIDEPIFHTQFIKGVLLNIFSAYAHVHLYNKEFNKLKNLIKFIDDLNRTLKFNENTPSYELLCKIKGDFWLFNSMRDINASISFYEKALKLLPNSHPKKPIILFNMGYCHFLNDEKKKAVDYLGRCINEFNNLEPNKSPFDFYYRPNALTQKVKTAKKIINLITSGQ
jgi:tetratricopeptide (TPR) repeat protein